MTRHKPILTDAEMHALICGNPSTLGLSIARLKDFIRQVEKAVVAKLVAEQEPLAWYVNNDITFDQQTADSWKKNLFIVKPLYENPSPSIVRDKTACISENGESETQVSSRVNFDSSKGCDDSLNLELARHQPCGCVVCYCENQVQCLGCGAEHCGTHDLGEIPNPVYTNHFAGVRNMVECAKCGHPAIHYLVMDNLGYPNKTPFCGDCTQEHEQLAQDTNEHEIRNFGGAYGLVAYHYEPLGATQPDHIPDTSKMVFDPDAALTLAERTLNIEITEPLADEIVQFACKLHEKYAQADHIPDAGKMLNLSLSVDTKEAQTLLQSYLDSLDGWQLVPVEPTQEMVQAADKSDEEYSKRNFNADVRLCQSGYDHYLVMLAAAPKYTGDSNE